MQSIKFFRKKTKSFLKSIDTITTKLLMLVLFVITIPLMVIGNFSTDIINQNNKENSDNQVALNKMIFEQQYQDENNRLKFLAQNSIERIINEKSSKKEILEELQKNYDLSFCVILSKNNNFLAKAGEINKKDIISSVNKVVDIAFTGETVLSSESINNNIYKIVATPIFSGVNKISSVLMLGQSVNKISILQDMRSFTDATVAFYKLKDDKALILNSNNIVFKPSSELLQGDYFNGIHLQNPLEINTIIPILNYFNEEIGNIYLGIPSSELITSGNRNIKSIGIIAVISLLVAMSIAGWFARTITNPILTLVDAAESIALGDLEHEVIIKGNDEMAQLSKTFNQMSSNLKKQEHLRDNFVATLTHDLKVPMLAENQTVTYMLKGAYGEITQEQKEVLELIKSTNNSSLEMIGTLLEVYRYDSGNVKLFESEFDMIELLKDSINQIKSLADDKKIQININSRQETILIKADKREIKRVLHNLISNAINNGINRGFINCNIDFIKEKTVFAPKIETESYTTLTRTLTLSNSIILSIEDNGIGIAREDMPLLFQRFSLSKGRKPAGAGLGLYYSYQVIIQHNGNIWAESSEKGGSVFKLTLPIQTA
ncbi:MAG: HAMP domain-containing sensor histidine kinase [bacterium]